MTTKHSQGTWKVAGEPRKRTIITVISDGINDDFDLEIAHIEPKLRRGAADANAKLIAAAPNLLEACASALADTEMLLSGECEFTPDNLQATIETLQKAIKLATI